MSIGDRIRAKRIEIGMSQEELAKKLGYKSRSSINKIELGARNLTQSKIKAIADALETTPAHLMGWEDPPPNPDFTRSAIFDNGKVLDVSLLPEDKKKEVLEYIEYLIEKYSK